MPRHFSHFKLVYVCNKKIQLFKSPNHLLNRLSIAVKKMRFKRLFLFNIKNTRFSFISQKKEQREYEFLNFSAEERYQKFAAENAQLIDHLTQNDVARYLGITPVALSRIKKRTANA